MNICKSKNIHATSLRYLHKGLLLLGPPGSGKSDLCLRLIEAGGILVADDQTIIEKQNDTLFMSCPDTIKGKLEVRGIGICDFPFLSEQKLDIVLQLTPASQLNRLPGQEFWEHAHLQIPSFKIDPFELSILPKINCLILKKAQTMSSQ